jgi:hypothetical protein
VHLKYYKQLENCYSQECKNTAFNKIRQLLDGENIVPVLNSMLVTESIPVWVRENTKEYSFENLKQHLNNVAKSSIYARIHFKSYLVSITIFTVLDGIRT